MNPWTLSTGRRSTSAKREEGAALELAPAGGDWGAAMARETQGAEGAGLRFRLQRALSDCPVGVDIGREAPAGVEWNAVIVGNAPGRQAVEHAAANIVMATLWKC